MNQLAAWAGSWASRSSSVLLAALVGMVAAVTAVIVVSVRGVSIMIEVGSPVLYGPATKGTGGLEQGWPPAVAVRARGPPARGGGGRCRVPVSSSASALLFVTSLKPAAAGAAPVADVPSAQTDVPIPVVCPCPPSRSPTMRSHGPREAVGSPALLVGAARPMTCRGHRRLAVGTCIGSPHRVAPTISRGEPVRVERVAPCGQLPLPLETSTVSGEVFAGLPEEVRQATLVLLARLIARAALQVGDNADGADRQ